MAITLLLSTSCAPLKRSLSHGGSVPTNRFYATSDWSDVIDNSHGSGAVGGKSSCGTTEQTADGAGDTANVLDGGHSCQHHASSSSPSIVNSNSQANNRGDNSHVQNGPQQGGQRVEILDNLTALPVQCDIIIVPRAHPIDQSVNASFLDSNDTSSSSGGGGDDDVMQPVRIPKQTFHPCGMDNIVRLGGSVASTSEFILSLANCSVPVDSMNEREDGGEVMRLPVQAVPSSFAIPSFKDDMGHRDTPYSYSREKHTVEEVVVSFDFTMAVDVYQQRLDEISAAEEKLNHGKLHARVKYPTGHEHVTTRREHTTQDFLSTANNVKNMEINSIMSTLEQESQFIKKTLFIIGSFGCALFLCMVWTIYKLERGRRPRRRVKRVFVDNVPCEIIGTTGNNAATMNICDVTSAKSKSGVTSSLRSNNGRAHHFPEEISPIRSSLDSLDEAEEEVDQAEDVVADVLEAKKAVHETLHLIAPQDVVTGTGSSSSNTDERQKSSSPRHWYEDFLSPKGCSKKAPRNNRTDDAVLLEHEEVARSLFCSSSSTDGDEVSPSVDKQDTFDTSKGTSSSSLILDAPKKKVLVTPIEGSSVLSPPLMISTETEGTHESSTSDEVDQPQSSVEVIDKKEHCTTSPTFKTANEESSESIKPSCTPINTPKPKKSRTLRTPSTDISISSHESRGEESSEAVKPSVTPINTPKPKSSRTLRTPATDISISSSEESQSSTSQRERKIFAQELAKKALSPPNTQKTNFSTIIAKRAAEVQTPKKTLTPLSADDLCDDEPSPFLADYW